LTLDISLDGILANERSKITIKQILLLATLPIVFAEVAAPNLPYSPTDWSDVDQLIKDISVPVFNFGGQLQQFLTKVKEQMEIPAELHAKLS